MARQNADQIGGEGPGSGALFFLRYLIASRSFFDMGVGVYTITDGSMTMENFQADLLPSLELRFGHFWLRSPTMKLMVYLGGQFYGYMERERTELDDIISSYRHFNMGVQAGGGIQFYTYSPWSFYVMADYRYCFFSFASPKAQYMFFHVGLIAHY